MKQATNYRFQFTKVFAFLFAILILGLAPLLTACGDNENSQARVKTSVENFLQHMPEGLFEYDETMNYSETVESAIATNQNFRELRNEYELTAKIVMGFILKHYRVFAVAPLGGITEEMQDSYGRFEDAMTDLKNTNDTFMERKQIFESAIAMYGAESATGNQKLIEFKREYSKLINKCEAAFETFSDSYSKTYKNLSGENADIARIGEYYLTKIALAYYKYAFDGFECVRFEGRITLNRRAYLDYLQEPKSSIIAGREAALKEVTDFAPIYLQEEKMVMIAIEKSNLREIVSSYSGNLNNYKNSSPVKAAYYNKFETFFSVTVPAFRNLITALEV